MWAERNVNVKITLHNDEKKRLHVFASQHVALIERYADGKIVKIEKTFLIDNNSAGIYEVGSYRVFVDTKGNTQIRSCYIVNWVKQDEP